jgi:hypothetical protein
MDASTDEIKITANDDNILSRGPLLMGLPRNTVILCALVVALLLFLYTKRLTIRSYIDTAMRLVGVTKGVDEPSMVSGRGDVTVNRRAGGTGPRGVVLGKRSTKDSSSPALNTALIQPDTTPVENDNIPVDGNDSRDDFTNISCLKRDRE